MDWVCYETPRPRDEFSARKWHSLTGETSVDGDLAATCSMLLKPERIVKSRTNRVCQTCAARARVIGEAGPMGIDLTKPKGT